MLKAMEFYNMIKRYRKLVVAGIFTFLTMNLNGCILDAFDTLIQQIPFKYTTAIEGTQTSLEKTTEIVLDDNDFYNENKSKIEKIKFVKMGYKTESVIPNDLAGNIIIEIKDKNGVNLIEPKTVEGNKPSEYKNKAFELSFDQTEIKKVNDYLSVLTNNKIIAVIKVVTSTEGQKKIEAELFAVFEMEYKI